MQNKVNGRTGKRMVKILAVLLMAALLVAGSGCGKKDPGAAEKQTAESSEQKAAAEKKKAEDEQKKAAEAKKAAAEKKANDRKKAAEAYAKVLDGIKDYPFHFDPQPPIELSGYQYALVPLKKDGPLTLLVDGQTGYGTGVVRVFSYDEASGKLIEPQEGIAVGVAPAGGFRGSLGLEGNALSHSTWSAGNGEGRTQLLTLGKDALTHNVVWEGRIDQKPKREVAKIEWYDLSDRSPLEELAGKSKEEIAAAKAAAREQKIAAEKAAGRMVLKGKLQYLSGKEALDLQNQYEAGRYDAMYSAPGMELEFNRTYAILSFEEQDVTCYSLGSHELMTVKAYMVDLREWSMNPKYDGKTVWISVAPKEIWWPSDASIPYAQPRTDRATVIAYE